MKLNLPIKSTYVPDWGLWECLRELIQNAKDEEDQHGHAMAVEWKAGSTHASDCACADCKAEGAGAPNRMGKLIIRNEGADMDRKALLIGHSGKAGANLRGKFGEGLDLALLAGVRAGARPIVFTRHERWEPTVVYSKEYGANCLTVETRARKPPGTGVMVMLDISEFDWERLQRRFVFLSKIADNRIVRIDGQGAILLDDDRKGNVYVRGIYVDHLPKLECGYDLTGIDLDRDRRMIDVWDLQYRLGQMYRDAAARRPELLGPKLYGMLRDGAEDVRGFHYHARGEALDQVVASFRKEHGEDAVPVGSIAEAREMEHVGKRGIVVSEPLREALSKSELDAEAVKKGLKNEVIRSIPWGDLSFEEKAIFTQYTTLIDSVGVIPKPIAQTVDIVEFRDQRIEGLYHTEGRISIARRMLTDPRAFLVLLVHEVAHHVSAAGDGTQDHVQAIETTWAKLFFSRTAS